MCWTGPGVGRKDDGDPFGLGVLILVDQLRMVPLLENHRISLLISWKLLMTHLLVGWTLLSWFW